MNSDGRIALILLILMIDYVYMLYSHFIAMAYSSHLSNLQRPSVFINEACAQQAAPISQLRPVLLALTFTPSLSQSLHSDGAGSGIRHGFASVESLRGLKYFGPSPSVGH
ncbi:uncharacterized protein LOC112515950 [Cynara cardunculus var. scolymus]|uniref:uncharacterized protein LOC112515950 n=1 Tax=Cynara cardunculus var. scolymus TaxID=59895 RepID=UPI000D62EDCB|nr:uncharacterized protein LOC112515950 [Cynara cardunculus var. scolymus]